MCRNIRQIVWCGCAHPQKSKPFNHTIYFSPPSPGGFFLSADRSRWAACKHCIQRIYTAQWLDFAVFLRLQPFQVERVFANQSAVVHISTKFLTQRTFNRGGIFQRLNRTVRRGGVPVAPVNRSPLAVNVKNQPVLRMWLVLLNVPRKQRTPFAGDAKAESGSIREALAECRGAVPTRFVEPHRVAKGCPLWHKRRSKTPRFVYVAYRACSL